MLPESFKTFLPYFLKLGFSFNYLVILQKLGTARSLSAYSLSITHRLRLTLLRGMLSMRQLEVLPLGLRGVIGMLMGCSSGLSWQPKERPP